MGQVGQTQYMYDISNVPRIDEHKTPFLELVTRSWKQLLLQGSLLVITCITYSDIAIPASRGYLSLLGRAGVTYTITTGTTMVNRQLRTKLLITQMASCY